MGGGEGDRKMLGGERRGCEGRQERVGGEREDFKRV